MSASNPALAASSSGLGAHQVALALALLLGLQPITTDLYLPALPLLARDLAAPMASVQLTMSALLLSFGMAQLIMGPLSDRFGRRPVLLGGLSLYSLASLGCVLAPSITTLIALRALQGAGLAAAVVCARAMVRDLYEPHQGAQVMSRGLSGLGLIAFLSPALGGVLAAGQGWRAALTAVTLAGIATGLWVWWRLPETLAVKRPDALRLGPWLAAMRTVSAHTGFRAWTALSSFTYGGLFVLLAGSSFVYIGTLGLAPWAYGAVMATGSLSYIAGTFACRRLLLRYGLLGTVWRGAFATAAGGLSMLALALGGQKAVLPIVLAHWVYLFGHGIHQPCSQTAAVGAFPQMAGVASALSGFVLAAMAFLTGLWLGRAMDGSVLVLASGLCFFALLTSLTAWTVVQRFGQLPSAARA